VQVKPGLIELHPEEKAIVVNYEVRFRWTPDAETRHRAVTTCMCVQVQEVLVNADGYQEIQSSKLTQKKYASAGALDVACSTDTRCAG
jgi:hypothetical protein